MDINVRRIDQYFEMEMEEGNATITTGLISKEEAVECAKEFIRAAESLLYQFDEERKLAEIREGL